ncbi:MAG: RNase adapter RapZ [Deltaproteobacteria bacterium]|nr:RNase adapter RapZ [Deltaproteobacteria bacterium]
MTTAPRAFSNASRYLTDNLLKDIRLVVISGPSGSGKSTAMKALEDLGFFCVDNMPAGLMPKFMELAAQSGEISKAAAVVDVRGREFLAEFIPVFTGLKKSGYKAELVFLEAADDALVRRFSETRRRHPLAASESPLEGLERERELLSELKANADRVIDTTGFNVHELREMIRESFSVAPARWKIALSIVSFGYRWGIPVDADLVIDIRFLPNPYFAGRLRPLDGKADEVRGYVLGQPAAREFLARMRGFLEYLIPLYRKEGKSYLTVAIGCTGGRHRSVVIADVLAEELASTEITARVRHRDIGKF